jgi:hypothetical protein
MGVNIKLKIKKNNEKQREKKRRINDTSPCTWISNAHICTKYSAEFFLLIYTYTKTPKRGSV